MSCGGLEPLALYHRLTRFKNEGMNVIVLDQYIENRPLLDYALRLVPVQTRRDVEILVERIGLEIYSMSSISIIGLPWVNPRGVGKRIASLSDYLDDPLHMYRALEVAFTAPRANLIADGAVIAVDIAFQAQLTEVRNWVESRLSSAVPRDCIVWHAFDPNLGAVFAGVAKGQDTRLPQGLAEAVPLPSTNTTLDSFCNALRPLFK